MNRIQTLIAIVCIVYVGGWLAEGFLGISVQCNNSNCTVNASTSLENIIYSIFIIMFIVFYRKHSITNNPAFKFGWLHKFVAFAIDFMVIMVIATSYAGLPMLISESTHTGVFNWTIHRDFMRGTDHINAGMGIITILIIGFFYFYKHKKIQKLTPGQYILSGIK